MDGRLIFDTSLMEGFQADRARAQEREEQTRWELEATLRDLDEVLGAN